MDTIAPSHAPPQFFKAITIMSKKQAVTRTGGFPVGFRSNGPRWRESIDNIIRFALDEGFSGVDVSARPPEELRKVTAAGLTLGSIDLPQPWAEVGSADAGKRNAAVQRQIEFIRASHAAGGRTFFICVLPEDHARKRQDNFKDAVEGWSAVCDGVSSLGVKIVIEGWPGSDPHVSTLACTPEGYRAMLKAVPGNVMAINFDPSHLIRMGIDAVRFAYEFAPHFGHVHAKDTEIMAEALYEFGNRQPATFAPKHGFGGHHWRYTIPGHGEARWTKLFSILKETGYKGMVSIELEDENFSGSEENEKLGFIASRDFLIYA
jgi:sugar phosphate isomerase/epimerase